MAITGRFVLLALIGIIPILLYPLPQTVMLWAALLLVVLVVDLLFAGSARDVRFARNLPQSVRLDESCTGVLLLANDGKRRIRGSIKDGWQPSAGVQTERQKISVSPAERQRLVTRMLPKRRGDLQTEYVTIRSFGPLGMAARQRTTRVPGTLRVLPPFRSKKHLPSKLRMLRELEGKAAIQIRGAGTEFDSLRDYIRGDDVRSIDWRATARRQAVVVRTWRPEQDRRVIILLDTSRTSAARIDDEPRLDTEIEAALLLSVLAERGGDHVEFIAFDRRIRARAATTNKGNLLSSLVQAIAPIQAELIEMDWAQIPAQVRSASAHRSLVVLLTALDSGTAEEGLLPTVALLAQNHLVVVASVTDPLLAAMRTDRVTGTQAFEAAAAERAILDRAAVSAQLKQLGAEVVDADPQELPIKFADIYIRLKAAGRL